VPVVTRRAEPPADKPPCLASTPGAAALDQASKLVRPRALRHYDDAGMPHANGTATAEAEGMAHIRFFASRAAPSSGAGFGTEFEVPGVLGHVKRADGEADEGTAEDAVVGTAAG
jgi:hypothetical protein